MVVTFFVKLVLDKLSLVKPGLVWAYKTLRLLNGLRKIVNTEAFPQDFAVVSVG